MPHLLILRYSTFRHPRERLSPSTTQAMTPSYPTRFKSLPKATLTKPLLLRRPRYLHGVPNRGPNVRQSCSSSPTSLRRMLQRLGSSSQLPWASQSAWPPNLPHFPRPTGVTLQVLQTRLQGRAFHPTEMDCSRLSAMSRWGFVLGFRLGMLRHCFFHGRKVKLGSELLNIY